MPEIDDNLAGQAAEDKLQSAWNIINADRRQRLLYATFRAYGWVFLSGIPPRLAFTALTFAQPFLITALVDWMGTDDAPADYGPALTGAVVLVYSSLAVCVYSLHAICFRQGNHLKLGFKSNILASNVSFYHNNSCRTCLHYLHRDDGFEKRSNQRHGSHHFDGH
jgi:ATP-binding cassette, subfamily C (CFTR/MRP), member 1